VAGAVVAALVFAAIFLALRSRGAAEPAPAAIEVGEGGSGNVILTGRDEAGRLVQLAVLVPEDSGGFNLYTIPSRTLADTPGHGFQQLDHVIELGGQELLDQTVADLLQVPIQFHVDFNYATLEVLLAQAGSVNFRTTAPLDLSGGGETVHLSAGDNPAGAQRSLAILKYALADGGSGPQVQALFYQGLRESLALRAETDRRALAAQLQDKLRTDMDADDFSRLFLDATTQSRPFSVWPLPVRLAGTGANWYLEPLPDQVGTLMAGAAQDSAFTMEIRNGTSTPGVVEAAAVRLAPLRYEIVQQPDPTGVDFDDTQIRVGTEALDAGNRVRELLGTGTVIKDEYMEKRQITVIMGKDISLAELERR